MTTKKRGLLARLLARLRALLAPLRDRATGGATRPFRNSSHRSREKG